jgi:succinate-acetate transporter protein
VRQVQLLAVVACVVFTPLLQLAGQTGLLLLLLTAIIFAHVMLAPFKDETLNSTELASLMVTFANVCAAQIIGSCTPEHQNSWRSVMVAAGMLALNVALLAWIARAAAAARNVQWRQVVPAAGQAVRRLRAQLQKSISGPGV